jgi:hypothetical protein
MTIRALAVILAFALLNGCTSAPTSVFDAAASAEADAYTPRKVGEAERAACSGRGGSIRGVGMFGTPSCVIPYADAAKACRDKSDCQGRCIMELGHPGEPDLKPGDDLTGQCQKDTALFGCYAEIVDGKVRHTICVD